MTSTHASPNENKRTTEAARRILGFDRGWAVRVERAREAREQGRHLRRGKAVHVDFPRIVQ